MIALAMVVLDELRERPSEVPLAKRDHPIEQFFSISVAVSV
jgi:hypothetical protein